MREVELKLVANNNAAVASVRELATASQKLYDNNEKQQKTKLGLIEREIQMQKQLSERQAKAQNLDNLKTYNNLLSDSKNRLNDLEQAGLKADKQTQSLSQSIGKWALSIGGAAAILGVLKDAVMKLTPAINAFNIVGAVTSQVLNNIVTGTTNWTAGVAKAIKIQEQFNKLRYDEYKESYEVQKLETEFRRKWSESLDAELTTKERIVKIDEALLAHNKAIDMQIKSATVFANANLDKIKNGQYTEENVKAFWDSMKKIEALKEERYASTDRMVRQGSALEKKDHDDSIKRWYDEIDAKSKADEEAAKAEEAAIKNANETKLKLEEDYQKDLNALIDKYNASGIASKTGVDKLKAQKDFALDEITSLKNHLINASLSAGLGGLTESQEGMIETLRNNVQQAFLKAMEKEAKATPEQKTAITKALLKGMPTGDEIQKYSGNTTKPTKPITSIWEIFGIDPESDEGKKEIEGITKVYDTTIKMMDDLSQKRVEDAQRTRELLDTQVSEAQSALEQEIELYKAGYASNVGAKQKEVADLKKVRDKAILDETAAIQRQRQIQAISQTADLLSATASLIKIFAKIPVVGLFLAAGAIVAMFKIWDAAKKSTAKATGYAKGGRGEVTGRLHSQGGESFLDHVEIEQGEKWGVLSRSASRKYGNTFYHMVDSFNRDALSIPKQGVINNILLDTSETNGRLDELIQLNKKENKEEIFQFNGMTIYKKGSTTRTIKR